MKKFISQSYRRGMLIFLSILLILGMNGVNVFKKIQSIEKIQITALVDENLRNGFEEVVDFTKIDMYYKISYSDDAKSSHIVLTSDIEKIDQSKEYKVLAHSPLVLMMKQSKNLNDLLVSYNEKGFLISDSQIKNNDEDKINCDFLKLVDVINNGGNWSDLGGNETKQITVYCPKLDTTQGKLFKEFLIRTCNKGRNESNEEIENKIQMFFNSDNVIQTDIYHKLQLLKTNISENIIFVGFEHDLLMFYQKHNQEFNFIYPEKTILQHIYVQSIIEDKEFEKRFFKNDWSISERDIDNIFYAKNYYRHYETGNYRTLSYDCNVQAGIDTFEN